MIPSIENPTISLLTMVNGASFQDIGSLVRRNYACNIGKNSPAFCTMFLCAFLKLAFFRLTLIAFRKQKEALGTSLDLLSNIKVFEYSNK